MCLRLYIEHIKGGRNSKDQYVDIKQRVSTTTNLNLSVPIYEVGGIKTLVLCVEYKVLDVSILAI